MLCVDYYRLLFVFFYACLSVGHAVNEIEELRQKISRIRGFQNGTKFSSLIEGPCYTSPPRLVNFGAGSPLMGRQNTGGCKKL